MPTFPEILAPVGDRAMCLAAIHNGADAIYLGMPNFNARGRSATLSLDELGEMIALCHLYGVRVFVACNILIFEQELAALHEALAQVVQLRPDAFIVQDIGVARLLRKIAPHQVIHASTQMTVSNVEAIAVTADLDMKRYVLARELSLAEIERIRRETDRELEVFVHGALCVSYSGQCLTSERMGGRSANRGQCAQSCRLPYKLFVDGEERDLGDRSYLVSPQDLCGLSDVDRLMTAGVDSFKIEGRLKSPEYVASTVRSYREKVRGALAEEPARIDEMQRIFSRGFFNGWFDGVNHQRLVDGRYGNHHGLLSGSVLSVGRDSVTVHSRVPVMAGDGVVFADFGSKNEIGATVYGATPAGRDRYTLTFRREFECHRVPNGATLFVNSSPAVEKRWRQSFTDKARFRRVPVTMKLRGSCGEPLTLLMRDSENTVEVQSEGVLERAERAPLEEAALRRELAALSGSPFVAEQISIEIPDGVFLHHREIKGLRQRATAALEAQRSQGAPSVVTPHEDVVRWIEGERAKWRTSGGSSHDTEPGMTVTVREVAQLDALEGVALKAVYLDYEFGKEYGPSLERVRAMGVPCGIATTRILKPGERGHLDYIRRLKPDLVLVRNLGALHYFQDLDLPLIGDFSLNITNALTAGWFLQKRLDRFCPSYDLNREQLASLLDAVDAARCEVTVHQYMPEFHMEHCVFAAFLSTGKSYRDCGKPCERHRVELQAPDGSRHPLKADAECRNTMFNGTAQTAAKLARDLCTQGVRHFRVEALFESAEELRTKLIHYSDLIAGRISPEELGAKLGLVERYGVSDGQLLAIRSYKDRKKSEQRDEVSRRVSP